MNDVTSAKPIPLAKLAAAQELDTQIRQLARHTHLALEALHALVAEAQATNIHEPLGFKSWPAYVADALDGQWKVEKDKRGELVKFLAAQGISERAIAKIAGIGRTTVQRELAGGPLGHVLGLDGKTYTPKPKLDHAAAEQATGVIAAWADKGRPLVTRLVAANGWLAMGYDSWDAFVDGEFGRLGAEVCEMVRSLNTDATAEMRCDRDRFGLELS